MNGQLVSAKVTAELAEQIRAAATADDRSVSSVVRHCLRLEFNPVEPALDAGANSPLREDLKGTA